MTAKIIAPFLLSLICLLLTADTSARQALDANELAGRYVFGFQFGESRLILNANGTYSDASSSCTFTTAQSGRYVLSDGVLRLTILKYTARRNGEETEVDLFDPQGRKEIFGSVGDEKVEPLKNEFSLVPVKWDSRLYLIPDDDLEKFSEAVNQGLEPRSTLSSEHYYGAFFLREGDEKKSAAGMPSLPARWRSLLLSETVTGEIIAIEEQGEDQIATINRGSRDGLKVGMKLFRTEQEPSPWPETGNILSVEENSAKVRVYDLKIGDSLSTRYVPRGGHK